MTDIKHEAEQHVIGAARELYKLQDKLSANDSQSAANFQIALIILFSCVEILNAVQFGPIRSRDND